MSEVKERPILFSAPMVRALLDGTKMQTRRTNGLSDVNANPGIWVPTGCFTSDGFGELSYMAKRSVKGRPGATFRTSQLAHRTLNICPQVCPYGKPGDRLWVRETFNQSNAWDDVRWYRADGEIEEQQDVKHREPKFKWSSPIHMPRWASRITLEVTEVRVQRLQDISKEDAVAEGALTCTHLPYVGSMTFDQAKQAFQVLWESINGTGSWDANPFVWAVSFKSVERGA